MLLILQNSCEKDSQKLDDFDIYDNYSQPTIDSVIYILDVLDDWTISSNYIIDTKSGNDSIWLCIGSRLSDRHGFTGGNIFGFYLMAKLAVKTLEITPDINATFYYPAIQDLLKLFPPNQELKISQTDLPWTMHPNPLGEGVVFTWGVAEQYRTPLYEILRNHDSSSCKIVRSEIHDSQSIKVELVFDIYLKHREIDKIIHIKDCKLIVLIYRQ